MGNGLLVPGGVGSLTPAMQLSVNTVDAVTESIKSDRTIRMWKVEAMKVLCMRGSRGGDRGSGPPPPWNLKILPKKR